jgi:hypothetical protein
VAIEVDDGVLRDRDTRTLLVIRRFAVRHDHVQAVDRAALEEADQNRAVRAGKGR